VRDPVFNGIGLMGRNFPREVNMDILYIGLVVAFVALSIGLVHGFEKLMRRPK
jgi:hypothetical protein